MPLTTDDFYWPARRSPAVLLIEDDQTWGEVLSEALGKVPITVTLSPTASDGFKEAQSKTWDAVVIDLRLPGDSGVDLCRRLIDSAMTAPIILIAQSRESIQYLLGFELGAADCLHRPFDPRELAVRLKAVLRRGPETLAPKLPKAGRDALLVRNAMVIDFNSRIAMVEDKVIDLTPQEFDLLHFLALNPGTVYSRSELLVKVWHVEYVGRDHTVDSHVNRIRQKLGESSKCPRYIHTIWSRGYRFEAG